MTMKKHKPDPTCLDLWENRARKFQLLRDLYFVKTPAQKLMLCVLELTIGNYRELRIPMRTLAQRCILSEKRGYAVAEELRNEGLIKYIPQRGKAPLFQILWHWVDQVHTGQATDVAEAFVDEDPETVDAAVPVLAGEKSILASEKPYIRNSDFTPIESLISSSTSPSSGSLDELKVKVMEAGVDEFDSTVRTAIANGMTDEQIVAVVDHFHANPDRWTGGVLKHRLTKPGARLQAPGDGWFGDRPEWLAASKRAAQATAQNQTKEADVARVESPHQRETRLNREAKYGPVLDAMSPAEQKAALAERLANEPESIPFAIRCGLASGMYRDRVLILMELLDAAAREAQGRRDSMARLFAEETAADGVP